MVFFLYARSQNPSVLSGLTTAGKKSIDAKSQSARHRYWLIYRQLVNLSRAASAACDYDPWLRERPWRRGPIPAETRVIDYVSHAVQLRVVWGPRCVGATLRGGHVVRPTGKSTRITRNRMDILLRAGTKFHAVDDVRTNYWWARLSTDCFTLYRRRRAKNINYCICLYFFPAWFKPPSQWRFCMINCSNYAEWLWEVLWGLHSGIFGYWWSSPMSIGSHYPDNLKFS